MRPFDHEEFNDTFLSICAEAHILTNPLEQYQTDLLNKVSNAMEASQCLGMFSTVLKFDSRTGGRFSFLVDSVLAYPSEELCDMLIQLWSLSPQYDRAKKDYYLDNLFVAEEEQSHCILPLKAEKDFFEFFLRACAQKSENRVDILQKLALDLHAKTSENRYRLIAEFLDVFSSSDGPFLQKAFDELKERFLKEEIPARKKRTLAFLMTLCIQRAFFANFQEQGLFVWYDDPSISDDNEFDYTNEYHYDDNDRIAHVNYYSPLYPHPLGYLKSLDSIGVVTAVKQEVVDMLIYFVYHAACFEVIDLFSGECLPLFDPKLINALRHAQQQRITDDKNYD